jgi:hypothetical protein
MWGESPSKRLGFDAVYSDLVCWKIDAGLAQFKIWYDARMQARRKVGKYGQEAKYKTLKAVLGVYDEMQHGGFKNSAELSEVSEDYLQAVIAASKEGKSAPDIVSWMNQRMNADADVDFAALEDRDGW